jgi:hypothetical protein
MKEGVKDELGYVYKVYTFERPLFFSSPKTRAKDDTSLLFLI